MSLLPLLRKTKICQVIPTGTYISRLYLAQKYDIFWRMNVFLVPRCTFPPLPLPCSHRVNEAHCAHKFVVPPRPSSPKYQERTSMEGGEKLLLRRPKEKGREEDFSSIKKAGPSLQKFAWLGLGELRLLSLPPPHLFLCVKKCGTEKKGSNVRPYFLGSQERQLCETWKACNGQTPLVFSLSKT